MLHLSRVGRAGRLVTALPPSALAWIEGALERVASKRRPDRALGRPCHSARKRASLITTCVLAAQILLGSGVAGAGSLNEELLRNAPRVLDYLKEHGFKTVGVLKFRVQDAQGSVSDRVGPLNLNLATRLELALVLTTEIQHPVNVIRDASSVAARLPGANHLTPDGRRALFDGRYRLAWGDTEVAADGFLTGVVAVDPGLHELTVAILGFGRESAGLELVVKFTAGPDPPVVVDLGESFLTRGMFDGGRITQAAAPAQVIDSAVRVREGEQAHPLLDPSAPVTLEILYDDRPVALETRGGTAFIPEPREGQTVTMVLRKRDATAIRYGVVLVVNGENTLFKERTTPLTSSKWILSREVPEIRVRGYQSKEREAEAFRILSPTDSKRSLISYGPDAGTIQLVVFREEPTPGRPAKSSEFEEGQAPEAALGVEPEDLAVLKNGAFPQGRPANLAALRAQLPVSAKEPANRGLIRQGTAFASTISRVEFHPDPTAVLSAKITYYRPK
jgi:hypothetical protein